MTRRCAKALLGLIVAGLLTTADAAGAQPGAATGQDGIGYPTVADALQKLKARPGVTVSLQGGWTIVDDPASASMWSFAPADHAAYPAVVKRTVVKRDGIVAIEMRALCQAQKEPCDALMAQFAEMNQKVRQSMRSPSVGGGAAFSPSAQQRDDAASLLARFHAAVDAQRYADAYAMFTPGMQASMPLAQFAAGETALRARANGPAAHTISRTTWYKDPPNAVGPGIFTAFDETCASIGTGKCVEVVILHQPPEGTLRVMRYEHTVLDGAK